jgi:hypothetical protein
MDPSKQYARIEKTVIFFSGGTLGCRQNPSLYKTGMQEGDNNTGER